MKTIWVNIFLFLGALICMGCFEEFAVGHAISSAIAGADSSSIESSSVLYVATVSSSSQSVSPDGESDALSISSSAVESAHQSSFEAKHQSSSNPISSAIISVSSQILSSSSYDDAGVLSFVNDDTSILPQIENPVSVANEVINSLSDSVFILNERTLNISGISIKNIEAVVKDTMRAHDEINIFTQYNFMGSTGEIEAKLVCFLNTVTSNRNYQLIKIISINGMPSKKMMYTFNEDQELLYYSMEVVSVGEYSFYYVAGSYSNKTNPHRIYYTPVSDTEQCRDTDASVDAKSICVPISSIDAGVVEASLFYNKARLE